MSHQHYEKVKRLSHKHPELTRKWHAMGHTGYPPLYFWHQHGHAKKSMGVHHKKVHHRRRHHKRMMY